MSNPSSGPHLSPQTLPAGSLKEIPLEDIVPDTNNPRLLFDPEPLASLKASIKKHGVLVPITVHKQKGTKLYRILDGERRYRCCAELTAEGTPILTIKANIVDTPDRLSGLLAMFSIHNFREGWELMPTALSLKEVMNELDEMDADTKRLHELTGLSEPQIERCKTLMVLPEEFQLLSLEPNPRKRIPSNFWTEAEQVVKKIETHMPQVVKELGGRDGIWRRLVEKYQAKSIKSVIHFRRVMEAFTLLDEDDDGYEASLQSAIERLREWLQNVPYDTREAFDELVHDKRRIKKAVDLCDSFTKDMQRLKLEFASDREDLQASLKSIREFVDKLLDKLSGEDMPQPELFDEVDL
ncbi:MAG: ParB/RepB/Spo0J family partition protein [Chthonomonas sp.]|nr:ParB/RepB/Spo0J family partition protein [Chthonomonas sp.]